MISLLRGNPVLLLFVVAALGYLLGRVRVMGFGLGVAAVLFAGLAVGSLDRGLGLPDFVYLFGLVLFVYTMGLASGPAFFRSLRRRGLRDNGIVLAVLAADAALVVFGARVLGLGGAHGAGLFAGALTNTPALAAVLETLKSRGQGVAEKVLAEPVVAYSVAYPGGVLGVLAAIYVFGRARPGRASGEASSRPSLAGPIPIEAVTVRVTQARIAGRTAADVRREEDLHVVFGRLRRAGADAVVTDAQRLLLGDLVSVVGATSDIERAVAALGERSPEHVELGRGLVDVRRMFVSNPDVTERPLRELDLGARFSAVVTRVRRGDVDFLADDATDLELGDRVRIVAPREKLEAVATFLGDSYKALAEIDVIAFSVGIAVGLVLGEVPIPLPGGGAFKLGFAGGPLVVGLVLGRLGRTGPIVWTLPFTANLTLRQMGLVLFLAGIGTRSGFAFGETLREGGALTFVVAGAALTLSSSASLFLVGRAFGISSGVLAGLVAGAHTQPAALAFAVEHTGSESPNVGYATVFPLATIAKIVLAQAILALCR